MDELIMRRGGAAEFLKMPVRTIDYLVQTDQIPYSRLGKKCVRFNRERLLTWMETRENVEFRHKTHKGIPR